MVEPIVYQPKGGMASFAMPITGSDDSSLPLEVVNRLEPKPSGSDVGSILRAIPLVSH